MMLRIILIILPVLVFSHSNAQRFNSYADIGLVASQVSSDSLGGFDKAGWTAGIGVTTPLTKKLKAAFEISYIQKGSKMPNKLEQGDPAQYLMRLNYLEVPVSLGYSITDRIDAYAGIAAAYLFSSYEANENGELLNNLPYESLDLSVCGGVSYLLTDQFSAHFRGSQSMLPIRKFGGTVNGIVAGGQYNSVLELLIAFYFKKNRNEE